MENKNITVAVIDFGSTSIKGAIASKRFEDGKYSINILANAEEPSDGCILRGTIFNLETTALKVQSLLNTLERLTGKKVSRVYAGIGGQSLRTAQHLESLTFDAPHEITDEDVEQLRQQASSFELAGYELLMIESPEYYVNSQYTSDPVGVQAMKLDARYRLLLAKPQKKHSLIQVLTQKLPYEICDIEISPLILSDVFLTNDNKKLGCALIDMGGGSTTICVYKNGLLQGVRVIPLGGQNITQDITSLHITPSEAERVKCSQGSCQPTYGDKAMVEVNTRDKLSTKQVSRYEIHKYIEARTQEIVDNIKHHLGEIINKSEIGGDIIITGGASQLTGITKMLSDALGTDVHEASTLSHHLQVSPANRAYITKPHLHLLYALISKAYEECIETRPAAKPVEIKEVSVQPEKSTTEENRIEEDELADTTPQEQKIEFDEPIEEIDPEPEKRKSDSSATRKEKKKGGFMGWAKSFIDIITPPDEAED
ncbi:MAG: cell division protein FtsA [Porphyromonas sp.]|nr:cell division protein FtsA [Porphyromonas sp.]